MSGGSGARSRSLATRRCAALALPVVPRCELSREKRWLVVRNFVSEDERASLLRKALLHMERRRDLGGASTALP